jgi:hypothetical protein
MVGLGIGRDYRRSDLELLRVVRAHVAYVLSSSVEMTPVGRWARRVFMLS